MFSLLDKMIYQWRDQLDQQCRTLLEAKTKYFHHRIFGREEQHELIDLTAEDEEVVPLQGKIKGVANPVFNRAIKSIVLAVKATHKKPVEERKQFRTLRQRLTQWRKGAEQLVTGHTHNRDTHRARLHGCGVRCADVC